MNSISIGFAVLALFALVGFILTFRYKDKLDAEGNAMLFVITVVSFIVFTIASMNSWKTNEELYKSCMDNTQNAEYCSKYLKEQEVSGELR